MNEPTRTALLQLPSHNHDQRTSGLLDGGHHGFGDARDGNRRGGKNYNDVMDRGLKNGNHAHQQVRFSSSQEAQQGVPSSSSEVRKHHAIQANGNDDDPSSRKRRSAAVTTNSSSSSSSSHSGSSVDSHNADAKKQQPVDEKAVRKRPRGEEEDVTEPNKDRDVLSKEEHRLLVEAIYDIGLKHASPAVIFEHMTEPHQEVTGERLKSHLQKYRKNKEKSREEFMQEYDTWMEKALTVGCAGGTGRYLAPPKAIAEIVGSKKLLGGDLPAFLSYSLLQEQNTAAYPVFGSGKSSSLGLTSIDVRQKRKGSSKSSDQHQVLSFPILTEEERKSPLGTCISQVIGLFYPMAKYMMSEREKKQEAAESVAPNDGPRNGERHPHRSRRPSNPHYVEREYAGRMENQSSSASAAHPSQTASSSNPSNSHHHRHSSYRGPLTYEGNHQYSYLSSGTNYGGSFRQQYQPSNGHGPPWQQYHG